MFTQTHDALDTWVTILTTVCGAYVAVKEYTTRGWRLATKLEKIATFKLIDDLSKTVDKQWIRIDEMRDAVVKKEEFVEQKKLIDDIRTSYVSHEFHEEARKELRDDFREAIRPLTDSINKLTDQVMKLMTAK